jgi:hypothetical protein
LQHVDNVIHVKAEKIQRFDHDSFAVSESHDFR